MNRPAPLALWAAIDATWPAAEIKTAGGWTLRRGAGGGSRVSAATTEDEAAPLAAMEAEAARQGVAPLVRLRHSQTRLDRRLAKAGYAVKDPTNIYSAPVQRLAIAPPPVRAFTVDLPPLAIQREIWAEGGIDAPRLAVMARAKGPKTALLGRAGDSPAGTGFVALAGEIAMVHALEVRPAFRRRGVARNMMRAAAIWAQDQGASWLAVLVTQANDRANRLYRGIEMDFCGHYLYRLRQARQEATGEEALF